MYFSNIYADKVNSDNKDIQLPTSTYCDYIDVIVTIHHTDTVSVAISCSFRPIAIDCLLSSISSFYGHIPIAIVAVLIVS
jgi:hypothetical protein